MQKEMSWKVIAPIVVVLVAVLGYALMKMSGDGTVPDSAIKAPAPPGGFPAGGGHKVPDPGQQ